MLSSAPLADPGLGIRIAVSTAHVRDSGGTRGQIIPAKIDNANRSCEQEPPIHTGCRWKCEVKIRYASCTTLREMLDSSYNRLAEYEAFQPHPHRSKLTLTHKLNPTLTIMRPYLHPF